MRISKVSHSVLKQKNCVEQVIANLHEDVWEEGVGEVDQREVSVSHLAHCFAIFLWCLGGEISYRSLILCPTQALPSLKARP